MSLGQVVSRILEQWTALQLYFQSKYLEERLLAAEQIHNSLNDPFVKLYFLFLNFVLPKVNILNQYFQSEKVLVTNFYNAVKEKFTELLLCYMDGRYVRATHLSKIDPENETHFLPNRNIYLGVEIIDYVNKPEIKNNTDLLNYFYERCKEFFKVLFSQIKLRFDFDDPILSVLHIFTPEAISFETRNQYPSLHPILQKLKRFYDDSSKQLIDDEWRSLPSYIFPDDALNLRDDIDVFWGKLFKFRNEADEFIFKNVSGFGLNILSLPHSNAACERMFSIANAIKTKSRNRLIISTMNGTLLSREWISKTSGSCVTSVVTKNILSRMTTTQLYPKQSIKQPASTPSSSTDEDDVFEIAL